MIASLDFNRTKKLHPVRLAADTVWKTNHLQVRLDIQYAKLIQVEFVLCYFSRENEPTELSVTNSIDFPRPNEI